MFNSTVLEVGIGLIFCFCAVSLIVSSINETLASMLQLRSSQLLEGVKDLLNDPKATGVVLDLYNHALVNPRGSAGMATSTAELCGKPSYIPSKHFALALIDVLQNRGQTKQSLAVAIDAISDAQLKQMMQGMYDRAAGDIEAFEQSLSNWFDNGMARVAGAYKRRMQLWTLIFGFTVAVLFNIDTVHLFQSLWVHPGMVQSLSSSNAANVEQAMSALNQLPIGWNRAPTEYSAGQLLAFLPGWLLTALSTLFGAPFWFDLLQKASNLRGSGPNTAATPV
ncbi:hypothetical protein FNU76_03250 [Chitinimonas arctica]|uniref:Uncharacterized protein n=1 Tax=Chitinimonas arctica TaxID=2594795 RepID=A0A516SBC3_9NEIS|nr:hypothetical protein [Chitinimonas arctica]QDQ25451.1 hypothetical protein FNU76_03250 [Chitinimonas arctica]